MYLKMLWFSEHLHLGDEGRAGAQERARMSVGDLFTPSLGFAEVSRRWPWSTTGKKGEQERRGGRECQSAIMSTPSHGFADVSWRWSATGMKQGLV